MNLPHDLTEVSLWAGLHDANCVHPVQPAGAHRYSSSAKRPLAGIPQIAAGYAVSPAARRRAIGEEEARLIAEYQSKCREESLSWNELESAVTTECNQVIDIADASLVTSTDNSVALRISGLLNYAPYRELFLRVERLTVSRGDGQELGITALLKMAEEYWDAFERRNKEARRSTGNQ